MTTTPQPRQTLAEATFAAIIFDMDGTLLDSTPAVVRSWVRWAEEEGIDPHRLSGTQGRTARSIVAEMVAADRVDASLARITELELNDLDGVAFSRGALDLLSGLEPGTWAIATSCARDLAVARLTAVGLEAPDVLVTADDVVESKPAPEAFLLAAERLGAEPRRCLVVEDAKNGVLAARAAGMPVMAVGTTMTWGNLEADVVVPDLSVVEATPVDGAIRVRVWAPEDAQD